MLLLLLPPKQSKFKDGNLNTPQNSDKTMHLLVDKLSGKTPSHLDTMVLTKMKFMTTFSPDSPRKEELHPDTRLDKNFS